VFGAGLFSCAVFARQFRISQYDGESLTIEYPPCFDGAYLFVEKNTNLLSGVWEVLDYMQVDLVAGAPAMYYPPVTNAPDETSGSQEEIPCVMTSEYIEALANGEIENDQWSADSVWNATQDGVKGFFRIFGLSFEDSDGDGVDNVTEYGRGTNPYTNDDPAVMLLPDHGDPKPVPGSINSTPGDWITGVYDSLGGAASDYCGWGFTEEADSTHIHDTWGVVKWAPVRPRRLHEKLANENPDQEDNLQDLATDPLFRPNPEELLGVNAEAFAGGTVSSHGGSFDYNTSNDTYPIDHVAMTDWLLAKAFPSRTRPMGSTSNSKWPLTTANFDMSSLGFENPSTGFFSGDDNNEWHHNDIREAPYIYVHKLFDKITE